jgi:hypothetical protein
MRDERSGGVQPGAAGANEITAGNTTPGRPPLPVVTDADVEAFHQALFARPADLEHVPVAPITNDMWGRRWREDLRRAIAADRARVAHPVTPESACS